jgi:hypothetical protein
MSLAPGAKIPFVYASRSTTLSHYYVFASPVYLFVLESKPSILRIPTCDENEIV